MGSLQMNGLIKAFDSDGEEIIAVDDLNLSIDDGEFIVLVGPSGCGKSTSLRCIAGLERPTGGDILIDDTPVTSKKPKQRDIAMVFQSYALYPHMTARENMSFGLKMSTNLSEEDINKRVEESSEIMGIRESLNKKPKELSGGQQQRVALGRAIVRDPEIFLMDEPLSNLDAKLRTDMRTELQELQQELGVTTIYVTHDQTEAMTMGDRIAIMNNGELQQIGTPLECYHRPKNQFVAGFIGSPSMNFINVYMEENILTNNSFGIEISNETVAAIDDEYSNLILGIRPEDIQLDQDDSNNIISTSVGVTEPMGDSTNVYFELAGTDCTATISGDRVVRRGQKIDLLFPEGCIHLFDPATTESIKHSDFDIDEATATEDTPVAE